MPMFSEVHLILTDDYNGVYDNFLICYKREIIIARLKYFVKEHYL